MKCDHCLFECTGVKTADKMLQTFRSFYILHETQGILPKLTSLFVIICAQQIISFCIIFSQNSSF